MNGVTLKPCTCVTCKQEAYESELRYAGKPATWDLSKRVTVGQPPVEKGALSPKDVTGLLSHAVPPMQDKPVFQEDSSAAAQQVNESKGARSARFDPSTVRHIKRIKGRLWVLDDDGRTPTPLQISPHDMHQLPALQVLDLSDSKLKDLFPTVEDARFSLPQLKELNLSHNPLGKTCLREKGAFCQFPNLERLIISKNQELAFPTYLLERIGDRKLEIVLV